MARRFTKLSIAGVIFVLWVGLTALYVSTYDENFLQLIKEKSSSLLTPSTAAAKEIPLDPDVPIVIFPKDFDSNDVSKVFSDKFSSKSTVKVIQYENTGRYSGDDGVFHSLGLKVFKSNSEETKCSQLENDMVVGVDDAKEFDPDLTNILKNFILSNSDYFKEVYPYFKHIENHFRRNTINKHFFKLAGSSVWLEQYGVHFMVSRVIYTPNGARNNPTVSLTYAQVFDEQWRELKNVTLIIPTNDVGQPDTVKFGDNYHTKVSYPDFLPIPTLHNPSLTKGKNYGAEDPRLLLVKDEHGFEQPLIVFNSLHRKQDTYSGTEDSQEIDLKYYRSMFVSWPWKFQKGKGNVDPIPNLNTDTKFYNKMIELRRNGFERQKKQKNWAPFVDLSERETITYDKYIYFVYRWTDLEVLRCELVDIEGDESKCEFVYRMNEALGINDKVGPLRGGTELIDIGKFTDLPDKYRSKQIWVGFARAHIENCGCNSGMYRPNLVVLSKEGENYNVHLLSSFTSLDITPISWNLDTPKELCGANSVIIPNGISSWEVSNHELDSWDDVLSLTFSLSDATINLIRIKGILSHVLKFMGPSKSQNYHIECALKESINFCNTFGETSSDLEPH